MLDARKAYERERGDRPRPGAGGGGAAEACSGDYDWDRVMEEGRSSGNPAEPLVRAIVARVGEDDARYVHLGAMTRTCWTRLRCSLRRALGLVLEDASA